MMQYTIRWLIRGDMPEVLAIENAAMEFPWGNEEFLKCLRDRNCIGMVFVDTDIELIRGVMIYELHKAKLRVLKLVVDPEFQRLGIGRAMVERLRGKLSQQWRKHIDALVRETNVGAQLFLQRLGFAAIDIVRQGFNEDEDEYLLRYTVDERPQCALGTSRFSDELGDV